MKSTSMRQLGLQAQPKRKEEEEVSGHSQVSLTRSEKQFRPVTYF
jgi:hypothetical protein